MPKSLPPAPQRIPPTVVAEWTGYCTSTSMSYFWCRRRTLWSSRHVLPMGHLLLHACDVRFPAAVVCECVCVLHFLHACLLQQPTVSQHFSSVPAEVQFVAYVNHEAVPEHDGDIRNYFTEVCLFKQNPNVFKRRPQEVRLAFLAFRKLAALMRRLSKALPQSQVASNCRKCLETIPQVERPGSSGPSAQRASCSRTKRVCQSISRACTCPNFVGIICITG